MSKFVRFAFLKKFMLFFILSFLPFQLQAQQSEIDSLKAVVARNKQHTETINALISLGTFHAENDINKSEIYLKRAVRMGREIKDLQSVAWAEQALAINQSYIGNYSRAIEMLLKTLKTGETLKNIDLQRSCLLALCYIYDDLDDYAKGFYYANKAYHISDSKMTRSNCLHTNGYFLCKLNRPDEALPYFKKEFDIANSFSEKSDPASRNYKLGTAYTGFGMVYSFKGNYETALNLFRKGAAYLKKADYDTPLVENYYYTALTFKKMQAADSSISYYQKSLEKSTAINYVKGKLDCYKELANLNAETNPVMAVHYFKLTERLNDSLFNYKKRNEIRALTVNEEERQEEILRKQQEEAEIRKQNIQYALIALGLVTLVILTLIFSKGVIKSTRTIKFLGVVALLILFEFINLLIHPFLEKVTHHSPILMLLSLVVIASLLIPIHHKLEKWAVAKLIERNKTSRAKYVEESDGYIDD